MARLPLAHRLPSFRSSQAGAQNEASSTPNSRSTSPGPKATVSTTGAGNGGLMLKINAIKARNLAAKDKGNTSDPYLVLTLGDARDSTVSISKSLNPEWNEIIELPISDMQSLLLEVVCWDKDRFGKDYMGEFDVALEDIFASGLIAVEPTWYSLQSRKTGRKKSKVTGEVLLSFSLYDPLHSSATPQQLQQRLLGMAATSADMDTDDESGLDRVDSVDSDTFGEEDDDDEETKDDSPRDEIKEGSGSSNEQEGISKVDSVEKRKRRLKLKRLKRKAKQRAYEFSGLSDLAGVLFIEICRISDLPPERNMTRTSFDMDPFVVTSLGRKTYRSRVIRHNLNPVYDEKLVFQVSRYEQNYSLNFAVVDRDKLTGNDFVGTANLPLESISSLAPTADPVTGLYSLRDPEAFGPPTTEGKKSRFRLPLSRTTSSNSIQKAYSKQLSTSQPSAEPSTPSGQSGELSPTASLQPENSSQQPPATPVTPITPVTSGAPSATGAPEDPDLKSFQIPLTLKNKERWEAKHKPILYINAKYLPFRALRQQFWRAMLRQYDTDDNGLISKVELTTMLDTLGSTLHEKTIDGFFDRFENTDMQGEPALTTDQVVICLEDWLQSVQGKKKLRLRKRRSLEEISSGESPTGDPEQSETEMTTPLSPAVTRAISSTSAVPKIVENEASTPSEDAEGSDSNDLAEEGSEEHVVKIQECPICHQPRLKKRSDADIIAHIATCASQDWRQVNNIVMAGFVTSSQAQRKWYSKVITKIGYGGYRIGANSANILVQDRITGQINEERMSVYVRLGIRLMYKGLKSREMEKKRIRKLLRSLSYKQGRKFDDPASAAEIGSFITFHQLDMSEVLRPTEQFKNFNEFFYRELKPDARPCSAPDRPEIITSPADCRTVVFDTIEDAQRIWIKGKEFTVSRLLGDAYPQDVKRYTQGGALGIFRLAPQDYHRFHIPVDGIMGEPKLIEGEYYTVNPMAIRSALDVYGENVRVVLPIDSVAHGRVMVICVGAMMVGSTVITRKPGEKVSRAEELGYFKFGGSTLILLFEPGVMNFDSDLVDNSNGALETLIRVGMSIGHSANEAPHSPDIRKNREDVTLEEKQEAQRRIQGSIGGEKLDGPSMALRMK